MPSLNLKTKKLRYAQADQNLVSGTLALMDMIEEYDEAGGDDAAKARVALNRVAGHIYKSRGEAPPTESKPTPPAAK